MSMPGKIKGLVEVIKTIDDFSASGFRLPTIAEWQSACQGGQKGYLYDNIDEIAWYAQNSEGQRHEKL